MSTLSATYVSADEHGDVDVLRLREEQLPEPGPGQVRLRVRAIGVNPVDLKIRQGMRGGDATPFRLGFEVAGVVEAVGPDVTTVALDDEVIAFRVSGGYASALTVPAADVVPKPASLPWAEAADRCFSPSNAEAILQLPARSGL